MDQFPPIWPLEDIVALAVDFKQAKGRWPFGITREGVRVPFAKAVEEWRQIGTDRQATARTVALLGMPVGPQTVADVAAVNASDLRAGDLRIHKLDRDQLQELLELMLKSMAAGGSIERTVAISGRISPCRTSTRRSKTARSLSVPNSPTSPA